MKCLRQVSIMYEEGTCGMVISFISAGSYQDWAFFLQVILILITTYSLEQKLEVFTIKESRKSSKKAGFITRRLQTVYI